MPLILTVKYILTAIAQHEDDVEKYFKFEMSLYPPSFFKDLLMR